MKIQSTKDYGVDRLKILIYGSPGVGKTKLASTTGESTLIVSAEAGLLSLKGSDISVIDITIDDNGVMIPKEKRIERLQHVYGYLLTNEAQSKYKWIYVDSLTEIGQNLVESLKLKYPESKDGLKMWGEYADTIRSLIKAFRDLPYYNVVFTALPDREKDENGGFYTGISLNGKISQTIPAMFDEVFYYQITKDQDGNQIRKLVTSGKEGLVSKDRSGSLNALEDPNLATITKKIKGELS